MADTPFPLRIRDQALAGIARVARGPVLMLERFRDAKRRGLRRLYALSRNYFRGSIAHLARFNLEPVWATDDFPQEAFPGSPWCSPASEEQTNCEGDHPP